MRILLIEDERQLSDALVTVFKKQRYTTDAVYDGAEGLEFALTGIYDVILLDVMLPAMDGFSVLGRLRTAKVDTPVIMLTARASDSDKIKGLDTGADDYILKPFSVDELLARIRAVSRRQGGMVSDKELCLGNLRLDLRAYKLSTPSGSVKLSVKEYDIMNYLMQNPKFVAAREDMITKIWGFDKEPESNNVEVYISFLRKKLGFIKSSVVINTVRGVGYRLEELCLES